MLAKLTRVLMFSEVHCGYLPGQLSSVHDQRLFMEVGAEKASVARPASDNSERIILTVV